MNDYDGMFLRYSSRFFGDDFDWLWFKAQCKAESNYNPKAKSPVGAMGLMQLMPGTASEMSIRLDIPNNPYDPETNICMGIGYDKVCWNVWKKEVGVERLKFMFASYNAGTGNIIKAQNRALIKDKWDSLAQVLDQVTGRHAEETINYVARIERYYQQFLM